jgi:hypothetical protein
MAGTSPGEATRSFQELRWAPVRGRRVFFRGVAAVGGYFALTICNFLTSSGRFVAVASSISQSRVSGYGGDIPVSNPTISAGSRTRRSSNMHADSQTLNRRIGRKAASS